MKTTAISPRTTVAALSVPSHPLIDSDKDPVEIGTALEQICPKELRIIINFETVDSYEVNNEIRKRPEISHIVEIKYSHLDENMDEGLNKYESSATLHLPTIPKILNVIEDVLLDISLYHTLIGEHKIQGFDKVKTEHINEWKLDAEDWNTKKNKEYISIAGYYRNASTDKFDALGYVNCWTSLAKKVLGTDELPIKSISEQLHRHFRYHQLDKEKIYKNYEKLNSGRYYLVRVDRIPKSDKTKSQLLPLFGGEKLIVGKTRFYPIGTISVFNNLEMYVSFFIVEK